MHLSEAQTARLYQAVAKDLKQRFGHNWREMTSPLIQEALIQSAVLDVVMGWDEESKRTVAEIQVMNLAILAHFLPEKYK